MRRAIRVPHLLMVQSFTAVLLVAGVVAAGGSGAVSSPATHDTRNVYAQSTTERDGIRETVTVTGRETTSNDAGTPNVRQSVAEVTIERVAIATGEQINFFSSGEVALRANQLNFSSSLTAATLTADVPTSDFRTGASDVANVDLAWRAADTTTLTTLSEFHQNPSLISLTTYAERWRTDAGVTGTVTYAQRTVTGFSGFIAEMDITSRMFVRRSAQAVPAHLMTTSVTLEGSAMIAHASYAAEIDPCVVASVTVTAKRPAGAPATADVNITEFNNCAGGGIVFQASATVPVSGEFTVAEDFSTARLNATADVGGIPITLDLTWSGGEDLSSQTLRIENVTPGETSTTIMQTNRSTATFAGEVVTPAHAIPAPAGSVGFLASEFAGTTTQNQ